MLLNPGKSFFIPLFLTLGFAWAQSGIEGGVAATAQEIRPLLPGMQAPDVTFFRTDGSPLRIREAFTDGPIVLIFYRGGW
jgi:hypothetical protein